MVSSKQATTSHIKTNRETDEILLEVSNIKKHFPIKRGIFRKVNGYVKAVDGISFDVKRGETFGIVGESGSGKSTLGKVILRLEHQTEGKVSFEGKDISLFNNKQMRAYRRHMQMIFQDPYSSLSPRMKVGGLVEEPMIVHQYGTPNERKERVNRLLETVGLQSGDITKYPHEFSGGQRQRIGIARALAINPQLIIADEPVSALDVSVQSQVLNLISDLQEEFNLTYIFISHDLSVVKHISDRIGVMYLGKMMELASKKELFNNPLHPYTQSLLSAVPIPNPRAKRERIILIGDIPNPANPPSGCVFRTRCPKTHDLCQVQTPVLKEVGNEHFVACHLYN